MTEIATIIPAQQTAITAAPVFNGSLYASFLDYEDVDGATRGTYEKALRYFFQYLSENGITEPTNETVKAYRDYLTETGHKPATVRGYLAPVRLLFQWLHANGYAHEYGKVRAPKVSREHKRDYFTAAQARQVSDGIDRSSPQGKRNYAIYCLAVGCGLRTIEISRANKGDLGTRGDSAILRVWGKGRDENGEFVKIPAHVETAINEYLATRKGAKDSEPLFTSTSNNNAGQRMTTRSISGILKQAMRNAGYDRERLTAHSLRHTAATLAKRSGNDITDVQQFMRHLNITTTMQYAHEMSAEANDCAEDVAKAIWGD